MPIDQGVSEADINGRLAAIDRSFGSQYSFGRHAQVAGNQGGELVAESVRVGLKALQHFSRQILIGVAVSLVGSGVDEGHLDPLLLQVVLIARVGHDNANRSRVAGLGYQAATGCAGQGHAG